MVLSPLAAVLLGAAVAAQPPQSGSPAARAVAAVVSFTAPAGWARSDYANSGGADPVVAFEEGSDRIAVYLYGSPGSFYKTPADFMLGPAATTMGRAPERAGEALVDGHAVAPAPARLRSSAG